MYPRFEVVKEAHSECDELEERMLVSETMFRSIVRNPNPRSDKGDEWKERREEE